MRRFSSAYPSLLNLMSTTKDFIMFEYVTFYKSYDKAIEDLSEDDQMIMYRAIIRYGLYEIEPELEGFLKTMWKLIKPQIEANHRNSLNGKKGGRPAKNKETTKEKKPQDKPTETKKECDAHRHTPARKKFNKDFWIIFNQDVLEVDGEDLYIDGDSYEIVYANNRLKKPPKHEEIYKDMIYDKYYKNIT